MRRERTPTASAGKIGVILAQKKYDREREAKEKNKK